MNLAAVNLEIYSLISLFNIFWGNRLESYGWVKPDLSSAFLGISTLSSTMIVLVYVPTNSILEHLCPPSLSALFIITVIIIIIDDGHPMWYEAVPPGGGYLHLSDGY